MTKITLSLFFIMLCCLKVQGAEDSSLLMNCPLVQITSHIKYENQSYQLNGQGWIIKDIRTKPHQYYILTPAHVVFGAESIDFSCPNLKFKNSKQSKLQLVGISPTYDLALLKLRAQDLAKKLQPLFAFDGTKDIINFSLPMAASRTELNSQLVSSFFWIEKDQFNSASAGLAPGGWPKTYSIFPYQDEITSINGVRPGMSGSLILSSFNNYYLKIETPGMVVKTMINAPYSVAIPLYEILPKLESLIRGEDPRKSIELASQPYVDFSLKKLSEPEAVLARIKVLKIIRENREMILGEDLCPSSQFTTVSDWIAVGVGGSIADSNGGGSIADGNGGGSIADGSDLQKNSANRVLPKEFTPAPIDLIRTDGKLMLQRSIFFSDTNCLYSGVKWQSKDHHRPLFLYGLKLTLNEQESLIIINSVNDLLRIDWTKNNIHDEDQLDQFIVTHGMFRSESNETIAQNSITNIKPFSTLCPQSKQKKDFISGVSTAVGAMAQIENNSGIKITGFESNFYYQGQSTRMFEDFQEITANNTEVSRDHYTCLNEGNTESFNLYTQSKFTEESEQGYSYTLDFKIKDNKLTIKLVLANGKSLSNPSKLKSFILNAEKIDLAPYWSQVFSFENGHKLEVHLDPHWNTLAFNLILNDAIDTSELLSKSAALKVYNNPDKPLKLVRLMYKLK